MVLRDIKFPFTTDDTILRGNGMDTIKLVFRQSKLQAFLFCRSFDSTQLNAASMLQTRLEKKMKTRYQFSNSYFESTGATSLFYMVKGRAGLTKDHDKKQLQCDLNLWQKYADGRYTVVMFVMP